MASCSSCDQKGKLNEKSEKLYRTKEGISCADCFIKFERKVDETNFLRVRVDIGEQLRSRQKRQFNEICEGYNKHKLLDLLGFKFRFK